MGWACTGTTAAKAELANKTESANRVVFKRFIEVP
jgi:hypothetical protein